MQACITALFIKSYASMSIALTTLKYMYCRMISSVIRTRVVYYSCTRDSDSNSEYSSADFDSRVFQNP